MEAKILSFSGKIYHQESQIHPTNTVADIIPKRASDIVSLWNKRWVYYERLSDNPQIHDFFRILATSRILYVVQQKDGPLLGTDSVYVHVFEENGDAKRREITIDEFCSYTADNPNMSDGYGNFLSGYAAKLWYLIKFWDEDADDFENTEQHPLAEVPDFNPEKIPVADVDETNGYEYSVIEVMGELHIPGRNFILSDTYCPPLLYLLIDAAYHLAPLAREDDAIHITRYGEGKIVSLTLTTSYQELLECIDTAILRGYPLLPGKYDTPAKRRTYIRDTLVLKHLDPELIGGWYMIAPDEDDEEE